MVTYYAKVTSKGQLTIPVELRRRMSIKTGETIAFDVAEDGGVAVRSTSQDLAAVLGTLPPLSISVEEAIRIAREEMENDAVQRHLRVMGQ